MEKRHGARLIKNAAHSLFNTTVADIIPWIASIWIARQLGVDNYGVFTLVLWSSGIFTWAIGMGFTHAITKFVAEHHEKGERAICGAIIKRILSIELILATVTTAALVLFATPIADYFFSPDESLFFILAFAGLLPGVVTAMLSSSIEGIQKFEYFTWANLILTPLSLAAKIGVVAWGMGISGLLIVMLVFSCFNVVFYTIVLAREGLLFTPAIPVLLPDLKKRIYRFNISVMAIILCDKIIWDKSENFFLGRVCTAAQVGFYNLGYNIVQKFSAILPTTFWKVLFPAMSGYAGSGDYHKTQRLFFLTTRYLAFIAFPLGVGGAILAYQIIVFLYGNNFLGAQRPMQILFLASIITTLCNPGAAILYGYERQSFIFKLGFIMAAINILLDLWLIKPYGATGAAICFAFTTVTGSVIGTVYTCHAMKLRYPFASILKILLATILMGIVMELVILRDAGMAGFIIAAGAGAVVYLVCALVLGTFEEEDYALLKSIDKLLPGTSKRFLHIIIGLVGEFKHRTAAVALDETSTTHESDTSEKDR